MRRMVVFLILLVILFAPNLLRAQQLSFPEGGAQVEPVPEPKDTQLRVTVFLDQTDVALDNVLVEVVNAQTNQLEASGKTASPRENQDPVFQATNLTAGTKVVKVGGEILKKAEKTITLSNGQDATVEFLLSLEENNQIAGNLTDVDKTPIEGVLVDVLTPSGDIFSRTITDATGKFYFKDSALTATHPYQLRSSDVQFTSQSQQQIKFTKPAGEELKPLLIASTKLTNLIGPTERKRVVVTIYESRNGVLIAPKKKLNGPLTIRSHSGDKSQTGYVNHTQPNGGKREFLLPTGCYTAIGIADGYKIPLDPPAFCLSDKTQGTTYVDIGIEKETPDPNFCANISNTLNLRHKQFLLCGEKAKNFSQNLNKYGPALQVIDAEAVAFQQHPKYRANYGNLPLQLEITSSDQSFPKASYITIFDDRESEFNKNCPRPEERIIFTTSGINALLKESNPSNAIRFAMSHELGHGKDWRIGTCRGFGSESNNRFPDLYNYLVWADKKSLNVFLDEHNYGATTGYKSIPSSREAYAAAFEIGFHHKSKLDTLLTNNPRTPNISRTTKNVLKCLFVDALSANEPPVFFGQKLNCVKEYESL